MFAPNLDRWGGPCHVKLKNGVLVIWSWPVRTLLLHYHRDADHPLNRTDLQEAVEDLVRRMPEKRRAKLHFANGRSGREWLKGF